MRGFKTVTEAAESVPGVLSGEAPGEPSSFSMRGFQQNQITELRDGLRAGPHNMTMRPQNTFNLERVEILKGPSSVLYGEGAVAGTINMVTKKPVLGKEAESELLMSYGRYDSWEVGFGSGSALSDHAAYRIDLDNAQSDGWVERADSRSTNLTGAVLWAVTENFELMLTGDYLDDDLPSYWGTPFVTEGFAANHAMNHVIRSTDNRVIDRRTRFLNYNVDDQVSESTQFWGRLLAEWRLSENLTMRNQFYVFTADRKWINSEQYLFNPETGQIDRDRFFVLHDQDLYGDRMDVILIHRWLGVVVCLFMAAWFASGAVLVYVPFPSLPQSDRLERTRVADTSLQKLSPADAISALGAGRTLDRLRLTSRGGRPLYILQARGQAAAAIWADDGQTAAVQNLNEAEGIASRFSGERVETIEGPIDFDQWIVHQGFDAERPFFRAHLGDAAGTVL